MGEVQVLLQTRSGRRFMRLAADLEGLVGEAQEQLADDSELIFQAHAPKGESGRVARSIHTEHRGLGTLEIIADAQHPTTGYHYVPVTRFGHRGKYIEPRRDRPPATVITTRKKRQRGNQAALRFVVHGIVFFRRRVKAYKPRRDWAGTGFPEVRQEAHALATRLGRRIVARFGE